MKFAIKFFFIVYAQSFAFPLLATPIKESTFPIPITIDTHRFINSIPHLLTPTLSSLLSIEAIGIQMKVASSMNNPTEKALILSSDYYQQCATLNHKSSHTHKHAISLMDNPLIYFGGIFPEKILHEISTQAQLKHKSEGGFVFLQKQSSKLLNLNPCIINQVIVNYVGIVEARHILMNNDHIVLE